MPTCAVPYCREGYKDTLKANASKGIRNPSLFKPKTEKQLQLWQNKVKVSPPLTMKRHVCEKHFEANLIKRSYVTVLKAGLTTRDGQAVQAGTVVQQPMGKATLHPEAVPTIFPDYPERLKNQGAAVRKPPKQRDARPPPSKKKKTQDSCCSPPQQSAVQIVNSTSPVEDSSFTVNSDFKMPSMQWTKLINQNEEKVSFVHMTEKLQTDKSITIIVGGKIPEVTLNGKECDLFKEVPKTVQDVNNLLLKVDLARLCMGTGVKIHTNSAVCEGVLSRRKLKIRCVACRKERDRLRKRQERKVKAQKNLQIKMKKKNERIKSLQKSKQILKMRIMALRKKVENILKSIQQIKKRAVEEAIKALPAPQQEAVMACFNTAKAKGPRGRRYTINWMYHCMLMRIKNASLYEHIREQKILPLPCKVTINEYLKNMSCSYGFKDAVFQLMEKKGQEMSPQDRRGIITLDEMKLTKGTKFSKSSLKVEGFVDMGGLAVDPKLEGQLGDHALVVMFQPFRGQWVQALACFLSKGNAKADVLSNIILEAVVKLEQSGYFVDGVTMDGASWNRNVWTAWDITEECPSRQHPCDDARRLWMLSDFPHLLKCSRNCISENGMIELPEGVVELKHWDAILEADTQRKGLREVYKLTPQHMRPGFCEKMKVKLAFQFWSRSCSSSMLTYRSKGVQSLKHCDASSQFCQKMNDMADAMNSSIPATALKPGNPQWKVIESFLAYFKKIRDPQNNPRNIQFQKKKHQKQVENRKRKQEEKEKAEMTKNKTNAKKKRKRAPAKESTKIFKPVIFSEPTDFGLAVTLKATLELAEYLCTKCSYNYLMTARLNQDCLESFFGMMRGAGGGNTHPEPTTFAQLFRLLSVYSLIKPPKGSNISGGTLLSNLLNIKDVQAVTKEERKAQFEKALDKIILQGENFDDLPDIVTEAEANGYIDCPVDDFIHNYMSGYMARHSRQYINHKCQECSNDLQKDASEANEADLFITLKSKGFLTYPSQKLVNTLKVIESTILSVSTATGRDKNILFLIMDQLACVSIPHVGCQTHHEDLTKKIAKSYLIMRMYFLSDRWNKELVAEKNKQRDLKKQAHLL